MADTGYIYPGTVVNDTSIGSNPTPAWADPSNAKTSNDSYAIVTENTTGGTTNYLYAYNFGISIPSNNLITGIAAFIERKRITIGTPCYDYEVKLVTAGGVLSTNKADTLTGWPTSDAGESYGGSTDTWGEIFSPSDVNNVSFGFVLSVSTNGLYPPIQICVDCMYMQIFYTPIVYVIDSFIM